LFTVYVYAIFYTFVLIFSRYCIKAAKFTAFRGKAQEFAVASQFREFCESRDGRKKIYSPINKSKILVWQHLFRQKLGKSTFWILIKEKMAVA